MNTPSQLRLAAYIIEHSLPWQWHYCGDGDTEWCNGRFESPVECLRANCEIRLTPPLEKWAAEKAASAEGKVVQFRRKGSDAEWTVLRLSGKEPVWGGPYEYRIAPSPAFIPLTPSDIPPGSAIRHPDWPVETWQMVSGVDVDCITYQLNGETLVAFSKLMDDEWEIIRPGATRGKPCRKPAP